jgi:hypothetical protein
MKAISLWQPWAQWVILGIKPIETRLHSRFKSLKGQRIAIHAAQHWDNEAHQIAFPFLDYPTIFCPPYPRGILGTVFVSDFRKLNALDSKEALIDCDTVQRWGLILREPKILFDPIPMKGRQGIFEVPLQIL